MSDNTVLEWISVEDEPLPKEGEYLVCLEDNSRHVASCHPATNVIGGLFSFDRPPVTHWMSLPELPDDR